MIVYYRLFDLMSKRKISKTDLRKILSPATVAKLSKNESVTTDTILKLCKFLDCQPCDIMECFLSDSINYAVGLPPLGR